MKKFPPGWDGFTLLLPLSRVSYEHLNPCWLIFLHINVPFSIFQIKPLILRTIWYPVLNTKAMIFRNAGEPNWNLQHLQVCKPLKARFCELIYRMQKNLNNRFDHWFPHQNYQQIWERPVQFWFGFSLLFPHCFIAGLKVNWSWLVAKSL